MSRTPHPRRRWPGRRLPAALVLVAAAAHASVIADLSLDEMVAQSDAVVHARVIRTGVRMRVADGELVPITFAQLRVDEWLKSPAGTRPAIVEIRELGGDAGPRTLIVAGAARYRAGQEVVAFLTREPGGRDGFTTLNMVQGKFDVVATGAPGASIKQVTRDLEGASFVSWREDGMRFVRPQEDGVQPLDRFLRRVRDAATGRAR